LNTVAQFEQSADDTLEYKHVRLNEHIAVDLCSDIEKTVLKTARRLWAERIDMSCNTLATHDTYLKLFQLSKNPMAAYQVVMLDESQDTNACVLDIFHTAQANFKVLVGDPYQQIYAWRGSVNAMAQVEAREAFLTESFRFGQDIADVANKILSMYGQADFSLVGRARTRIVPREEIIGTQTCLFRTNAGLLDLALYFIPQGIAVELNTDVKDLIKLIESAIALQAGLLNGVKHPTLIPFSSWAEVKESAKETPELARIVRIADEYKLPNVLDILKAYRKPTYPSVILTTAHKAKGLEFDNVLLANDFKELDKMNEEERNLLYVAVTRAKKLLALNSVVEQIIKPQELDA